MLIKKVFGKFMIFGLMGMSALLYSCGSEEVDPNDGEIVIDDDYYEFQDFNLGDYDIPAFISLPDETANIGASTKPEIIHIEDDIKWEVNVGQNFQLMIEDYGDLTDPTSGRDLTIEYKSAEEAGTTYPTTTIRVKPKASAVTEDEAKVAGFLESQTEITDLYSELSYDELKSVLEGWLNPSGEGEKETVSQSTLSQSTPTTQPTKVAPTTAESAKKTDDVGAAFDDLFNN